MDKSVANQINILCQKIRNLNNRITNISRQNNFNNYSFITVSEDYTATNNDWIIGVLTSNTTGNITITLPEISTLTDFDGRKIYTILDVGGFANSQNIIVQTSGTDTINGMTFAIISAPYNSINIFSNQINEWFIGL